MAACSPLNQKALLLRQAPACEKPVTIGLHVHALHQHYRLRPAPFAFGHISSPKELDVGDLSAPL